MHRLQVTTMMVEVSDEEAAAMESAEETAECEVEEMIAMKESDSYLQLSLKLIAIIHSLTSFSMLIAYYCLKVGCRLVGLHANVNLNKITIMVKPSYLLLVIGRSG